jgi:DNA-binding MarR family transcriptional regulator
MTLEMTPFRLAQADEGAQLDFGALARMRRGMNDLVEFVQLAAAARGCSLSMYHLLLAVKMSRRNEHPDIGMLATSLGVRHPSAAEMVRKAESAGFLESTADLEDRRRVLVALTDPGSQVLQAIAEDHIAELRRIRGGMIAALNAID